MQFAITWHITLTTKSGSYAAISIVCGFLPMFFLSPFAGVWADRYNRKTLIMLSDAAIAVCTLALAVLFHLGYRDVWLFFAASAVRGLGGAVQMPCVSAIMPELVPTEQLTRVNGINSTLQSTLMLVSPMLSGALMSFAPLEAIFFIDAITAALAIAVLLLFLNIPLRSGSGGGTGGDYFRELRQGFAYIGGQPFLRGMMGFMVVFCMMVAPAAFLTPLQVARVFGDDVWRLTAIEVVFSVGMIAGGIIIATWGGFKRNRLYTMAVADLVMGVCTLALGLPGKFWLYLVMMGLIGMSVPVFNTPAVVIMQERVHPDYLGRVFSVMAMINSSMMPAAMLVYGPLADKIAIEWLLIGTGVVMTAMAPVMLRNRAMMEAGAPQKQKEV